MQNSNFFERFNSTYAHRLTVRAESFRLIFNLLEEKKKNDFCIVETGCMRHFENMELDGMSTFLFDDFVRTHGGSVISIDISMESINEARRYVSDNVKFYCYDSVMILHGLCKERIISEIDFLYLDSFDLDLENPMPSSIHHLKELAAVMPLLKPGTLLCVDDNPVIGGKRVGKGVLVKEFMSDIGIAPIYDGYQIVWRI